MSDESDELRRGAAAAGTLAARCFRPAPAGAAWRQLNVGLVRRDGDARGSARELFRLLQPRLAAWSDAGRLHGWFFMRKPPDLRLRLRLVADAAPALEELDRLLGAAAAAGWLRPDHFWSDYHAEQARFGGAAAMELVHAHFHADSTLWLERDQRGAGAGAHETEALLAALLDDLFARCAPAAAAGWQRLAALTGAAGPATGDPLRPAALADAALGAGRAGDDYADCNARLAAGLGALAGRGELALPPIEVAASLALFCLNRHGLPGERSAPLVARVRAALA